MAAKKKARKKAARKTAGAKKVTPMDFIIARLKRNKNVAYADIKKAADKKRLVVYPVMYGRAKLLLGMVKPGKKKATKQVGKRGPGRPKGSKNKRGPGRARKTAVRRGPGRPRKTTGGRGRPRKVVSATAALQGLIGSLKAHERENAQLKSTIERVRDLIDRVV